MVSLLSTRTMLIFGGPGGTASPVTRSFSLDSPDDASAGTWLEDRFFEITGHGAGLSLP